jgi:D-xylose transport system ATP-binding protein
VSSFSGGQRQAVAVSRALLWGSKLVLFDEPTAALGVEQTGHVLELIRRLAAQGQAVLVVSHSLPDVFAIADRIVVLRLGERVAAFERSATNPGEVVSAITGGRTVQMVQ